MQVLNMRASIFDSYSFTHQFKLNYTETKNVVIGHSISSDDISAGGHLWRVACHPRGEPEGNGEHISVYLMHLSESKDVKAIFEAFVMDRDDGASFSSHRKWFEHVYTPKGSDGDRLGWYKFVERSILDPITTNGSVIIMCGVKVVPDNPIDNIPPSDIRSHFRTLLGSTEGSDVSFVVDGETFPAHRAVLAARSPVFKAQLLGSMADAKMASITLHDIKPATFRAMLRFVYTDAFPADSDGKLEDSLAEKLQDLFVAADRYALDRLKLLCARKMWHDVSADTVGATLACAETYNCPELKEKCIDYFADEKNFKKAVLTYGFVELVQKFPSILPELRVKVRA